MDPHTRQFLGKLGLNRYIDKLDRAGVKSYRDLEKACTAATAVADLEKKAGLSRVEARKLCGQFSKLASSRKDEAEAAGLQPERFPSLLVSPEQTALRQKVQRRKEEAAEVAALEEDAREALRHAAGATRGAWEHAVRARRPRREAGHVLEPRVEAADGLGFRVPGSFNDPRLLPR